MAETTEFNDEFNAENCCTNPNLPHEVNRARCLASAALIFGILNVFQFGQILSRYWYYAGVVSGLGALPSLLSASMLICCSPKQINRPGHGARHFTRAGCASAAGSLLYLVAVGVWIIQIEETKKCAADEELKDDYEYDDEVSTAELCSQNSRYSAVNPIWMIISWFLQLMFTSRCFKAKEAVNKIEVAPVSEVATGVAVQGIPVAALATGVPVGAPQTCASATATATPARIQGPAGPIATAVRVGS